MNRILVVDDDRDILMVLRANLQLHDFEVITADSWKKAEECLLQYPPDLILLDIMLPDGDGMEICRTLRKRMPDLPIIMLTARDTVSDKVIGLESGADDYVVKPFETIELVARIRACLRRMSLSRREERVAVGDITIDYNKREIEVRGEKVELTPKEYEILCFFVENRGEVLSRERIRRHLWKDARIYSWSRVIDVHIQHLRRKIEKDPSNPEYIITVPGAGYMFKA